MVWVQRFQDVFSAVQDDFALVLPAAGCREGWLQGEFYKRLRPLDGAFCVNELVMGPKEKADLSGTAPTLMAAEIKIVGPSYKHKNVAGYSNITEFLPKEDGDRVLVRVDQVQNASRSEGSILRDTRRLRAFKAGNGASHEVYQILVIDRDQPASTTPLGRVLVAVQITSDEWTFDYPGFMVRVWRL